MVLRIVVAEPLHHTMIARLRRAHEVIELAQPAGPDLMAAVGRAQVLVVRGKAKVTKEVIEAAPELKLVIRAGIGTDNIDLDAAQSAGLQVGNVPGGSADAVAELAFGLMLCLVRKISLADRQVRAGTARKAALSGIELRGRTMGLIGLGSIGTRLAELASGFGMRVLAAVANPAVPRRGVEVVDLDTLLERADVVSLQLPLTAQTRGLITTERLKRMNDSAFLIDVSRSGIIDPDDLLSALRDRIIAGAGLDVVDAARLAEFAELDNVVLTPHIGAMTEQAQQRIAESVADSIITWERGEALPNRIC